LDLSSEIQHVPAGPTDFLAGKPACPGLPPPARLLELRDGRVTFRYQDCADAHQHKTMTLDADEFLRRFVQHVLPRSFVKIRHYGLLANAQREVRLALCRRLLLVTHMAIMPSPEEVPIEPAQP